MAVTCQEGDEHSVMKQIRVARGSTVRRYATVNTILLKKAAMAAL